MIEPMPVSADRPLRIGTLGAARITPMALLAPARRVAEARVEAVAARRPERAAAFAKRHGIPRVLARYDELIDDPGIDAIYNPLPNALHAEWTIRALEAGKHVLCEKPLASNAAEARAMADAADRAGRILMEAFHWRYHPLAAHLRGMIDRGDVGEVEHIEAAFCVPLLEPGNIRYRLDLAGGATMDLGAYTVNMIRYLGGRGLGSRELGGIGLGASGHAGSEHGDHEPEVTSAQARLAGPGVDRSMRAELAWPGGETARMTCSLCSIQLLRISLRVIGRSGSLHVFNPIAPHVYHRVTLRTPGGRRRERLAGEPTYTGQLRAFVEAVRTGTPPPTDGRDGVANMRVIDAVYERAGLSPRGPSATTRPTAPSPPIGAGSGRLRP